MKVKELLKALESADPEAKVVTRESNMKTIGTASSAGMEDDVDDPMSGDQYGTCFVIEVD
jgi:hypothetical protein